MVMIPPPEIPEIGTEELPIVDASIPDSRYAAMDDMDARSYANFGREVAIGGTDERSTDFAVFGQQDVSREPEVEAPGLLELAGAQLAIDNPLVSAIQNQDYDSYVHDPNYVPENDPIFNGLDDYYGDWAFSPSAEASKAIAANLRREIDNRDTISRASLGANLGVGLATELLNPTNIPLMFIPVAKGVSMAAQAAKWAALGVGQEAANELMLHQSQTLRTQSESMQNLMFAGLMAGVIGGGAHWLGGRGSMAEAGRDLYNYIETGKIKDPVPPTKLKDDPLADAIGAASRMDTAGAMRVTPNITNVISDYSLTPIGRAVRKSLPADYIPPSGPSKLKGNPITRLAESPLILVRQNMANMVDSPYYHQAHMEGRTIGNELGSIESRVGLHEAQYAEMKADRQQAYMDYRKSNNNALNRVKAWGEDVTGQTAKNELYTQIKFREEIAKAVDNYGKHENEFVAAQARSAIKYFEGVKKDLVEVGLLDDTFKTGDTSNYLHRMYNRDTLIKNEDEFVEILVDHWQDMQGKYIAEAQVLRAERDAAASKTQQLEEGELDTPVAKELQPKVDQEQKDIVAHEKELALQERNRAVDKEDEKKAKKLITEANKLSKDIPAAPEEMAGLSREISKMQRRKEEITIKIERAEEGTKTMSNWQGKQRTHDKAISDWHKKNDPIFNEYRTSIAPALEKVVKLEGQARRLRKDIVPDETYRKRINAEKAAIKKAKKAVKEGEEKIAKEKKGAEKKRKEQIEKAKKSQEKVQAKFDETFDYASLSRADLKAAATETTQKIKGTPLGQTPTDVLPDIHALKAGALKQRTLDIPRQKIEKFLENDIDLIQRSYQRAMAPRIELARDYGDVDMKNMVKEIETGYQFLREDKLESMKAAGESAEAIEKMGANIQKFMERDLSDIIALRDKLLGTHMQPADPNGMWWRAGSTIRALQFMQMLGQMLISAIPDVARAVMIQGFGPSLRGLKAFAMNPELRKASMVELKKANVGWESMLNTRAYKMGDIIDNQMYTTKLERGIGAMTDTFAKATGMTAWNDILKSFSGAMIQDGMLRAILAGNKATKRQIRELAKNGIAIDGDVAQTIKALSKKHGKVEGDLLSSGGIDWTKGLTGDALEDAVKAQTAFRSAILKSVNETIVTVGIGEMPLWMGHGIAKQVMQFKSFAVSSHARALHSGLQSIDQQRLEALLISMLLGSAVYEIKHLISGRDEPIDRSNTGNYLFEVADRAGIFGYLGEVHNYAGQFSGNRLNVKRLWGGGEGKLSKYASRNTLENLAGPTAGTISNVQSVMTAMFTGDVSESDVRAGRKLVPFQNLIHWNWLLNRYNGISDKLINE